MRLSLQHRLAICLGLVALVSLPVSLQAQKALVYCPVAIDNAGCSAVVDALGADATLFPGGVDRGYDGAGGTVDLASADLSAYSVFFVPSLADDATAQPLGLLRNAAVAARLKAAFTGRAAVWSGTPDLGSSNLDKKDALIQNLARWARADASAGRGAGVIALLDASEDPAVPYSWMGQISELSVAADPAVADVYDNVETRTATGVQIVMWNGLQLGYTNMASGAITSAAGTVAATGGRGAAAVLITAAGEAGPADGLATVTTDKQDYSPGETVTVTGAGWLPGETVSMLLHEDPLVHGDRTLSAVADSSGKIFNDSFHPEDHDFGVRFVLTATGATSGRTAQTTFTDGNKTSFSLTATGAEINSFANALANQCVAAFAQARQGSNIDNAQTGTVALSSTAPGTTFFANGTCTTPAVTSLSFAGGGGSRAFSFRITTVGGPFTIVGAGSWDNGNSNHASATISVGAAPNTPPVANNDAYSVNEDNTLSVSAPGVLGNDTDAENNALTATLVSGPASGLTLNANGSFTFTPAANANGSVSFTYRANDGSGNSNTATVTISITAVNDAPTFAIAANQAVNEDAGAQSVSSLATGMTAGPADESGQGLSFTASNDNNALFSVQPAITAAGTLTYTPAANAFGTATVSVTLTDDGGTANGGVDFVTRFFTITVNPVNDAPSFAKGPDQTVDEDAGPQSVPGWATAMSAGPANESGQALSFAVTGNTNPALFSAAPAVSASGTLTYSPAPAASGTATISLQLADNGGTANGGASASGVVTFVITVNPVNDPPALAVIPPQTVKWGTAVSVPLVATDEDGPSLTYSVTGGPAGNTASVAGGTFSWTPGDGDVGVASFTVSVTDGSSSASQPLSVTVQPHATVVTYSGDVTGTVFGPVTFKATLTDTDAGNAPVAGKTIGFTLGTLTASAVTASGGAAGLATASATIPSGTGATSVVATYDPAPGSAYTGSSSTTPFTLSRAAVTVTMTGTSLEYDGAAHALAATVTGPNGAVTSPAPSYSYAGTGGTSYGPTAAAPRNVGSYQVTATFAGDADYQGGTSGAALTITARALHVTATADSKTYDRTTDAVAHLADDRVSGDALTVAYGSAAFADKTVGSAKTVTISGITVTGGDAGNYTFNSSTTASASITALAVSGSITAADKVYDGTTTASITGRALAGALPGDVVAYTGGTGAFDTKAVGTAKLVSATGLGLSGADAVNYSVNTTATDHADITQRTLVVSATGTSREYDQTMVAQVTFADDRVAGDLLTFSYTAAFADKNVGNAKPVTLGTFSVGGADAGNYAAATPTGITANITPRALLVTATGINKVYDQTTAAAVTFTDDRIAGDVLTIGSGQATFSDKNVGTAKPIAVPGIALSGADAQNYTPSPTASASADITPKPLVATAHGVNKIYDGTTAATVTFTDDRIAGDLLTYSASASFLDRNAGTGKPVQVTGIALGGADGGNYAPNTTASATADITPRQLTISATGIARVYDGTNVAGVTLADDRIPGDALTTAAATALFGDKHAGTNKPISVSGISLGGADAPNYTFNTTATASADVTPRALAVTAGGIDKAYDATTDATVTIHDDRLSGDVLTVHYTAAFTDANAGIGKTVNITGISLSGPDGGDYAPNTATSTTATISRRPLAIAADAQTKVYGATDPVLSYHIVTGTLAGSDAFGGALSRAAGEHVGTYAIGQTTLVLSANYDLSYAGAELAITPRAITITADPKGKVYGQADPSLTYQVTTGALQFTDAFTGALARVAGENVGSYAIQQGTVALTTDYTVAYGGANLSITPATLSVVADPQTKVYGQNDPTLSYVPNGFQFSDNAAGVLSGSLARAAGEAVAGSPYAINPGSLAANPNYSIAFTGNALSITPAPLAVSADPQTKVYGAADPALSYTVSGLQFSDTKAGVFSGALIRAPGETVAGGPYAISRNTLAANTNYSVTFTGNALAITRAPLSVTAAAATKVFGDALPAFTGVVSGIQLSDNITATWATTTPFTATSNAGIYANAVAGTLNDPDGRLPNYDVSYAPATFTISRATPVFGGLSSPSVIFGTASQTVGGTISFAGSGAGAATVIPQGATVAVSFNGATQQAAVNSATGAFSTTFTTGTVNVLGNPYAITYDYNNNDSPDNFNDAPNGTGVLTIVDQSAPAVSGVTATPNPVALGGTPIVAAQISDALTGSSSITGATLSVTGGTIPPQTIAMTLGGSGFARSASAAVPGLPVGVYNLCVKGTDAAGNTTAVGECVLVAVYDASGGFVTGGGWITSPAGAYLPTPALTGKATFGFVAKYKKGQQAPDGNTEFQFQTAGLSFKSTSYDWLVVAGSKAQYKGVGTVNGAAGYSFMLTAIDGDDASRKPDKFRMKITGPDGLVYDNQLNAPDTSDPATVLDGGSIVVHDK
jgi:VCBS repeat-containing protein